MMCLGMLYGDEIQVEGPFFIQEVVYDEISQDIFLRWDPQPNITKYNIQIFTCDNFVLRNTTVNSSSSVSQLSGVNFTKYGFLLVAVQSCVKDKCGTNKPKKNVVALNFTDTGKSNNYSILGGLYIEFYCMFVSTELQLNHYNYYLQMDYVFFHLNK